MPRNALGRGLGALIRELGLTDTRVLVSRFEELGEEVAPLDFVCARALGAFQPFLEWAAERRVAARTVVLCIGAIDLEEIRRIGTWEWQEPIPVPNSLRRLLLVGTRKDAHLSP